MKYLVEKSGSTGRWALRGALTERASAARRLPRGGFRAPLPATVLGQAWTDMPEASLLTDRTQRIIRTNAAFTTVTGFTTEDVMGRNCRLLQGPGTDPQAVAALRATLARGETYRGDILNYRKDGTPFWNALAVRPLRDGTGSITHFLSIQRDVTAQRTMQDRLRFLAMQDPLTGIANRTALDQHLWGRSARSGAEDKAAAVGIIDLDDFSAINESFGHEAGDVLLAEFAHRLRGRLSESDFVARLGGDEFVVIIENLDRGSAKDQLRPILRHLHQVVEGDFVLGPGANVRISMSMGLSLCPPDGNAPVAILRQADAALYRLKAHKTRPGQWWHLHEMTAAPAAEHQAPHSAAAPAEASGSDLLTVQTDSYRDRLFSGGLRMFFQPVVDLRSGTLRRLEALVRLALEDGTVLPPAAFLPSLAEADVDRLFRTGLDHALRQLSGWDSDGHRLSVSLNLAPSTLLKPECPQWVASALGRHNIAPDRLVVELLEEPIEDSAIQGQAFNDLLAIGVGIAMDDLGAGHSSLRRLTAAAFSTVKIDHRILTQLNSSPIPTMTFLATMIQMGRDMGWNVVAEGLEDAGITEAATIIGIPYGQGYYLARPMPAEDVLGWAADFRAPPLLGQIRTLLGALAFHWQFTRLGLPHPGPLRSCPLTGILDRTAVAGEAAEWHRQQHTPGLDHTKSATALLQRLTLLVTDPEVASTGTAQTWWTGQDQARPQSWDAADAGVGRDAR